MLSALDKIEKKKIQTCIIKLVNINLDKNKTHFLRGCIGNQFKQFDIIHNHNVLTGKEIYRYPLIQFKVINKIPYIIAFTENAINVQKNILIELDKINIKGSEIPIVERELELSENCLGSADTLYIYEFLAPWLALNQNNYTLYKNHNASEKKEFLKRCLIANIISVCKAFEYTVKEQITVELNIDSTEVILKGNKMLGFTGYFKVNFDLPDYIGLGKSVSRGYGCIKKII